MAKQLKADIWQHDPYGGNGEKLDLKTYEAGKFQQQLQLVLQEEMKSLQIELNQDKSVEIVFKESPYEMRQQDGSSCGAITIEDIILLAQGKTLNERLFPEGAPNLRQQYQLIYDKLQQNNTQTQTPKTNKEKSESETESSEQFSPIYSKNNQKPSNPSDKKKFQSSLEAVDYFSDEVKQQKDFNEKDLQDLMNCVMEGDLNGVTERLKQQPQLIHAQMKFVDYADQVFPKITPFQLAVWYGNWAMWERMRDKNLGSVLTDQQAALQYHALKNHSKEVSGDNCSGCSFKPLLEAYAETQQLYKEKKYKECDQCFVKKVGGGQKGVPAWYQYLMSTFGECDWTQQQITEGSTKELPMQHDRSLFKETTTGQSMGLIKATFTQMFSEHSLNYINNFSFHVSREDQIETDHQNSAKCSQLLQSQIQQLELSLPLNALQLEIEIPKPIGDEKQLKVIEFN